MRDEQRRSARIMVVDDEPQNVRYVTDVLEWAGYEAVEGLTDPLAAIARFDDLRPDLVILDLLMPGMDGFGVMDTLRSRIADDVYLPFLILTSDISSESRRRALSGGAKDFLNKPMSPTEVRLRVDNLLETRFLYLECARQAHQLADEPRPPPAAPTPDYEGEVELLERWAATIDAARPGGEGRSKRVSWIAGRIAEAMQLSDEAAEHMRRVALLHDLGSRRIRGAGTTGEHDRWRRDAEAGLRLLEGTSAPVLVGARRMLGALEEHWDGSGQPQGLRGDSIPVEARIVGVALRFDELSSDPAAAAGATAEVERAAGSIFDPEVVTALLHTQVVGA